MDGVRWDCVRGCGGCARGQGVRQGTESRLQAEGREREGWWSYRITIDLRVRRFFIGGLTVFFFILPIAKGT